jgi:ethanolamine kinase
MLAELHHLHTALAQIQTKLTDSVPSVRNSGRLHAFEQVLCHNDLLSGNILLYAPDKNKGHYTGPIRDVYLIDYEYAAYNFRAYDLANHFCEFGGFDFDIVNEFPSDIVRKKFIEIYLKGSKKVFTCFTHRFYGD